MKVLIAEDEALTRTLLETTLRRAGCDDLVLAQDGVAALELLQSDPEIGLAVLDWMMPGMDGIEVCRGVRAACAPYVYIILLTASSERERVIEGLDAGADDYMTKPFHVEELRARVRVGERTVTLKRTLAQKVEELQLALAHVQQLQGILPICMHCKRVRDGENAWREIEHYVQTHSGARFSHGICGRCLDKHYPEE